MASPPPFTTGTVTLVNGSKAIVGTGTGWKINGVRGGLMTVEVAGANTLVLASVDDDTHATAATKWMGPSGTYAYAISMVSADAADTIWASRHWSRVVGQALLAGIVPVASGTLAERDALDPQPANGEWFAHAEPPADLTFYRKVPAGWEGPYGFRGDRGPGGVGSSGLGLPTPGAAGNIPVFSAPNTVVLRAILGTVSHAGGIPTGALMEAGNNANGLYARWANGWQVCIGARVLAQNMQISYLGGFRGQGLHMVQLPASFVDAASYQVAMVSGGPNEGQVFGWVENRANRNAGYFQPMPLAVTSQTEGARYLQFVAAGRWF